MDTLLQLGQKDLEDQRPFVWVLDALAKLSTCEGFDPSHPGLKEFMDRMAKSPDPLVSLRVSEIRQLGKFNAFLRCSGMLDFDGSLSFLEGYIGLAAKQGAKPYQRSKTAVQAEGSLNFTPYPTLDHAHTRTEAVAKVWVPESESALKEEKAESAPRPEERKESAKIGFKGPTPSAKPAEKEDPKQRNKQLLATALVGGLKGQPTFKGPQKKAPAKREESELL